MRLYVFDHGEARDMPREARVRTGAPFDPLDQVTIPCMSYLIETDKGPLLYDTGWSQRGGRSSGGWPPPEEKRIGRCLARLGYQPQDIPCVICSHLHIDHAGELEQFTWAKVLVSQPELDMVRAAYARGNLAGHYVREDYEQWLHNQIDWQPIPVSGRPMRLTQGVDLLSFGPGHANGMLCLILHLPRTGAVILASDAIYCAENIGPPLRPPGILVDERGYGRTVEALEEYKRAYRAQLWYGHDWEQFSALKKADEGYYE